MKKPQFMVEGAIEERRMQRSCWLAENQTDRCGDGISNSRLVDKDKVGVLHLFEREMKVTQNPL